MEKDLKINFKISNTTQMFDEDGVKIPSEKLENMMYDKLVEVLKEYVEEGGIQIDFLNSEFGVDEAEDLSYYGKIEIEVKDGVDIQ